MTLYWCEPTAADDVAAAGVVEVSLYKRPRSAAGITSFLGWREDATTDVADTCVHQNRRQLWSFQVTLGLCHRCTAYTHRPHATCDRWPVRCLGSCSCAGVAEFATGRKSWKIKLFVEKVKHCYFIRWLQWFLSNPHVRQRLLLRGGVAGLAIGLKKYLPWSATWDKSLNHVVNNATDSASNHTLAR